jgi:GNAT superfamily N-acetyltransferase
MSISRDPTAQPAAPRPGAATVTEGPGPADIRFRAQAPDDEHIRLLIANADPPVDPEDFREGTFLVAYVNGQPSGCGGYRLRRGDPRATAEIVGLYVRPNVRQTGLARDILTELEAWAGRDGFTRAVLRAGPGRPGAQALAGVGGYRPEPDIGGRKGHVYGKPLTGAADSGTAAGTAAPGPVDDAGPTDQEANPT